MAQTHAAPGFGADQTISATVKALSSARGYSRELVARAVGMTRRTYLRRLAEGGWLATEVERLANFFACRVQDLYDGHVNVHPTGPGSPPDGLPHLDSNQKPAGSRHLRPTLQLLNAA